MNGIDSNIHLGAVVAIAKAHAQWCWWQPRRASSSCPSCHGKWKRQMSAKLRQELLVDVDRASPVLITHLVACEAVE